MDSPQATDRADRRASITVTHGMMEAGAAVISGAKLGDLMKEDLRGIPFTHGWVKLIYQEMELARRGE